MDADEVNQVRVHVIRAAMDGEGVPSATETATALGIVSLLGGSGEVHTRCPDCGDAMTLSVSDRKLVHKEGVVHFSVSSAHFWDDIIFT